jgi:hypothetical protein
MPKWFKFQWVVVSVMNATFTPFVALIGPPLILDAFGQFNSAVRHGYDGDVVLIVGAISAVIVGAFIGIFEEWWWRHLSQQSSSGAVTILSVTGFAAGALLGGIGFELLAGWEVSLLVLLCIGGPLCWIIGVALPIAIMNWRQRDRRPVLATP